MDRGMACGYSAIENAETLPERESLPLRWAASACVAGEALLRCGDLGRYNRSLLTESLTRP